MINSIISGLTGLDQNEIFSSAFTPTPKFIDIRWVNEVWGSHGDEYEDVSLLRCAGLRHEAYRRTDVQ